MFYRMETPDNRDVALYQNLPYLFRKLHQTRKPSSYIINSSS